MLSPIFNPQEFFFPEELLPLKKRGRDRSSSSTSTLPQEFEMGESSRKTSVERHEEQIEEILNHLDELSLDRIEHIEDNIEGLGKGREITTRALARFRIANLEQIIKEIQCYRNSGSTTANLANTVNTTRPREVPVARQCSYKEFMSCQPINFKVTKGAIGLICWFERSQLEFSYSNCTEDCKVKFATEMEDEFYHLTVKGNDLNTYVRRFQELATLCPTMMPDSKKMMEVFIRGLPRRPCTVKCNICNEVGHLTKNCRNKGPATGSNLLPVTVTCHACGEKGHYANQCRKTTNNNAQGRAYMLRDRNTHQNPNVVTGRHPVAQQPYRLAPSEMQELSNQLQELAD
ncbi:reverse transcriptase domain-containing protein [Tanacetum coccineum]